MFFTATDKRKRLLFLQPVFSAVFFLLLSSSVTAQFNFPIERDAELRYARLFYNIDRANFHTTIKPLRDDVVWSGDSVLTGVYEMSPYRPNVSRESGEKKRALIEFTPLADLQGGFDASSGTAIHRLGGGASLSGFYKDKLAVNFRFTGGTAAVPSYLDAFVNTYKILPGTGRAYPTSRAGVYSWQQYTGYVSWSPRKIFNLQAGSGKHFWGEGYRSLFLSDLSAPMPYIKMDTRIWKLQYVSLFTAMRDITNPSGAKADFRNKYGTFHFISWNAASWLNIGVFESIIWQGTDKNRYRGFDPNYLNPLIFFRPIEYSLGSSDNAFLGFSAKGKYRNQIAYFQLILDEFYLKEIRARSGWWANKQGIQLGWKSLDIFKINGLKFQAEFNFVRPYTYAHGSVQQGYTHFNQPLAHPFGANFTEQVYITNYTRGYFQYELKLVSGMYGLDTSGLNYGHDLFRSYTVRPNDYGNKTGQGLRTQFTFFEARASWLMYAPMNLRLEGAFSWRRESNKEWETSDVFIWLGFRSALGNHYYDF